MRTTRVIAAALLLTPALPAVAASPSPEEARRLVGVFETYLGRNEPGAAPTITVTPEGEGYSVSVDLPRLLRFAEVLGFKLTPATMRTMVVPQADGTWQVTSSEMPTFGYSVKDQVGKVRAEGFKFTGVFDPAIQTFRTGRTTFERIIADSSAKGTSSTRTVQGLVNEQRAERVGEGLVSAKVTQTQRDMVQTISIDFGQAAGGAPGQPTLVTFKSGAVNQDGSIERFKTARFMDLWAFLVSNASREQLVAKQAELKRMVGDVLPIFETLASSGKAANVGIDSPLGSATIAEVTGALSSTGLTANGSFATKFDLRGVSLKSALVPPWATGLVPSDIGFDVKASGYDLGGAAKEALELVDLADPKPLLPQEQQILLALLIPKGGVDVTVGPTSIKAPLYQIDVQGTAFAAPMPTYRVTVRAKGVDQVIKALQQAKGVPAASQVVIGLFAAKAMSKPDADGTDVWVIESDPSGIPLVNGKTPGLR